MYVSTVFTYKKLRNGISYSTVLCKILMGENIDEFDEFPAICQYFPYQHFPFS